MYTYEPLLHTALLILIGMVLGVTGQLIRIVVGLKKSADTAPAPGQAPSAPFDPVRLRTSLLIGLLVGIVSGVLAAVEQVDTAQLTKSIYISFIAAGYAGTDFIEGFMGKYLPPPQEPAKKDRPAA